MSLAKITIPLDADTARIFTDAPEDDQKKMRVLLSFWLREFATSTTPLNVLMDEISAQAQARGLTPEMLESLLNAN